MEVLMPPAASTAAKVGVKNVTARLATADASGSDDDDVLQETTSDTLPETTSDALQEAASYETEV